MTSLTNTPVAASVPAALQGMPEPRQFLTFLLRGEMFGIGILYIKEIIEYGHLTEIPMTPPTIRGVINLRGAVVPVIDLAARFGGSPSQIGRRTCIVIVEIEDGTQSQDIGLIVDAVNEVIEIPPADITPPPSFGARLRTDFIAGMGKVDGRFVVLLDIGQVLSMNEIAEYGFLGHDEPDTVAGRLPA